MNFRPSASKPGLVMFDLDGTLVDSLDDLADSMNAVLGKAGLPLHPVSAYRHFVGDGVANLVLRALPLDKKTEANVQRFREEMRVEYGRRWLDKTRPYPGIPELLAELGRRKIRTAILSNKPDPATQIVAKALFPDHNFDMVRGSFPDCPIKPDPTGALLISEKLGIPPSETLYVGDTDTDMKTGRAAGYTVVGVSWGFRPVEELRFNGAHHIIHHPSELFTLFSVNGSCGE